jgi:hypothetical protein
VRRITFVLPVVFLALSAVIAQAQDTAAASPVSLPLATRSQVDCTGFIAETEIPRDLLVLGGADDDFHSVSRQFVKDESIYISKHKEGDIAVGTEYSVVRAAHELFRTMRYQGERGEIGKLGIPYEDVATVKVTHVNPEGAVALVTFSCGAIMPGDTLVPFQPRAIPEYTVSAPLDPFLPLDSSKQHGRIAAGRNNVGNVGREIVVYLDLGEKDGAKPGARYRIYKLLAPHSTGFLTQEKTPPETVGEAVVLSVKGKSSVAMIVASYREISAGDYVEAE